MRKAIRGFTIVELLIVIVVIAILAAISIVAYNGIQTRAENAKTVASVSSWAKALRMYNGEKGVWPTANSCLGAVSTYATSGPCWPGWSVSSSFLAQAEPYIGSQYPEPSTKSIVDTAGAEYRGAMFYIAGTNDYRIYAQFADTVTCPTISGVGEAFSSTVRNNGRSCYYYLQKP